MTQTSSGLQFMIENEQYDNLNLMYQLLKRLDQYQMDEVRVVLKETIVKEGMALF